MFKSRVRREIYMINMDNLYSFNGISLTVCGECRGESGITPREQCDENIQTKPPFKLPFIKIKLQRVRAHSYTRAGLFDLPGEEIRSMTVYHRYNLGRYWRLRLAWQHPSHSRPLRRCTGRDVFNLELSKDRISFHVFGVLVPVGSRKCKLYCYITSQRQPLP